MTTGWVWHERYAWHDTGRRGRSLEGGQWIEPEDHAESPATKRRLRNLVDASGLLAELVQIEPQPAGREALERVHSATYLDRIDAMSAAEGGDAGENTPFAPGGGEIAKLAVGGCIAAAEAVLDRRVENAYALVRPPGHHAESDRGRGYCMFANVPVAVRHIQATRGVERVAIVDWDVHHGNGAQSIFWRDPAVLALSVHQVRVTTRPTWAPSTRSARAPAPARPSTFPSRRDQGWGPIPRRSRGWWCRRCGLTAPT